MFKFSTKSHSKTYALGLILLSGYFFPASAHSADSDRISYFFPSEPDAEAVIESVELSPDELGELKSLMPSVPNRSSFVWTPDIDLGYLINIGKAVWAVVQAGESSIDIKTDWASAIPSGMSNWESMGGWKVPVAKSFAFKWTNLKVPMIHFNYNVVFMPGGNVGGRGHYLTQVSVIPTRTSVFWGYSFSAKTEVAGISNVGTAADPVAGMNLLLTWTIETPLKKHRFSQAFFMNGLGGFKHVGGDFE